MLDRFIVWIVPRLIHAIYFILSGTIRWEYVGRRFVPDQPQRFLLAFWHARMLMMPYAFRGWQGYMLISEHRDGGFIADTMHLIGIQTVRGSSTYGGARALLQMIRKVRKEHCDLGITPDGPKGPREKVQIGTVQLAAKTGLPILPVCYATNRQWRISSWDHFYIPKPFSKGVFVFGDLLPVADKDDMDEALKRVQQAMDAAQDAADHYFDS